MLGQALTIGDGGDVGHPSRPVQKQPGSAEACTRRCAVLYYRGFMLAHIN